MHENTVAKEIQSGFPLFPFSRRPNQTRDSVLRLEPPPWEVCGPVARLQLRHGRRGACRLVASARVLQENGKSCATRAPLAHATYRFYLYVCVHRHIYVFTTRMTHFYIYMHITYCYNIHAILM